MDARYAFRLRFRLEGPPGVWAEPASFETHLYRTAEPPGEAGWRFFRDNLWHGDLADADHFRELTEDALGVTVESVAFSALETDEEYLDALKAAVGDELDEYNASSVSEALSKYLGSSIEVRDSL